MYDSIVAALSSVSDTIVAALNSLASLVVGPLNAANDFLVSFNAHLFTYVSIAIAGIL